MIHLRKLHFVWGKSALKSYKSSLSRPQLMGVLLNTECTSSVKVEESSREPSTNAENDTYKEVKNLLSKISTSTKSMDTFTYEQRGEKQYQNDDGVFMLEKDSSIEKLKEFIRTRNDLQKLHVAMSVMRKLSFMLRSKFFPGSRLSRYKDVEKLISPNELKDIFETTEKNLPYLNDFEWLQVFEICTILKMNVSSALLQKLIKLLTTNINSMSSIDVLFLYCTLEKYYSKDNPQIAALHVACCEFFENCFESNIHPRTTPIIMSRFVFLEYLPVKVRRLLIQKIIESNTVMPYWSYDNVFKGLILPGVFEDKKFHEECINYVLMNVFKILETDFYPKNLHDFLKSYKTAVFSGLLSYEEKVLDALALKFLKSKLPLPLAINSCHIFFLIGHYNYALFNYILCEVESALHSGELKAFDESVLFLLIKILSKGVKQHPKIMNSFFREKLEAFFLNYTKVLNENYKVSFPLNLVILGIYNDHLIENCFTSVNGGALTEEDIEGFNFSLKNSLLLLHQAIVTFHPSYQKNLLSEELMKKLALENFPVHDLWRETVENCFGGPNYVMKNCTTSLHHTLSYVIVLDKNNVPIDVASIRGTDTRETDEPFNISNIPTSEDKRVIIIQDLLRGGKLLFRNICNWKGKFHLYINVLEMYCSGVIPLFTHEFRGLDSYERVPYLLGKIEKKFGVIGKPTKSKSNVEASKE